MDNLSLPQERPPSNVQPLSLLNGNSGLDRLKPSIPEYRIEYAKGEDTSLKPGLFTFSMGGQKEHINCSILKMKFTRSMFPPFDPSSKENQPLCASSNGEAPTSGSSPCMGPCEERVNGKLVTRCPHAKWQGKKKPECSEIFTILGWDWDDSTLFLYSFKGTSIKHINRFKDRISNVHKWGVGEFPVNICVRLRMSIKQVKTWYECHMPHADENGHTLWEQLNEDEIKTLIHNAQEYDEVFQTMN